MRNRETWYETAEVRERSHGTAKKPQDLKLQDPDSSTAPFQLSQSVESKKKHRFRFSVSVRNMLSAAIVLSALSAFLSFGT